MTVLVDQSSRDLIRNNLDDTLVVEAAAGTGKTTELVHRIISILASGRTTIDRIVAVTFTEKAAGELKLRLREGLEKARAAAGTDRKRLEHTEAALAHLEEARAGTIHSFCTDLLRERPMEAGVDPQFEVLDDGAAERLYRTAFRSWLERTLEDPPESVRRSLRRPSDAGPMERLENAGWTLAMWRDFDADWERLGFDRTAEIDCLVTELRTFAHLTSRASDKTHTVYQRTRPARDLSDYLLTVEKSRARDYDGVESLLIGLGKARDFKIDRVGSARYGEGLPRAEVVARHAALMTSLEQFTKRADADLAALLRGELRESIAAFETLKLRRGKLDFLDLLVRTRDLLRDNLNVRTELQQRFSHIFVDEFQDTDPLQAEILLLLACSNPSVTDWRRVSVARGKLFVVGDPKQAIYRFRRADVGLYREVKELMVRDGAIAVHLSTSFRSVPFIQSFVNAAFQEKMTGNRDSLQADYVPLAPSREQDPDQPALVALTVPAPYGKKRLSGGAVEGSLPDAIGGFVDWLVNKSGWTVTERGREGRVPIEARHICIMFRRFDNMFVGDVTRAYWEALQARGIPHLLVGGKSFHDREEIETMRNALTAIEWPDDTLSVFATLHGSLFSIRDADLLAWRSEFHTWHPFRIPEIVPEGLLHVKCALETLRSLSRGRNYCTVSETIHRLLASTRAHAGFALRPAGEQALANVLYMAELARQYEAGGAPSFRGFVQELTERAERGNQAEAAIYEEGADGVRMMSVHRAKGLEFPVVILADITCKIAHSKPDRYLDSEHGLSAVRLAGWVPQQVIDHRVEEHARDVAEGVRVAYVAATRARDVLVVPAIGDDTNPEFASEWWVAPLYTALYPPAERRDRPARARMCPAFGSDTVLKRPDGDVPGAWTVTPGAHGFGSGDSAYSVIWWDPRSLELDKASSFGMRQQELLEKGDDDAVSRRLQDHKHWQEGREELLKGGAAPSIRVQTVTDRARSPLTSDELSVDAEVIAISTGDRPAGPRFGTLVHAVLATVPLDSSPEEIRSSAEMQGRILGATAQEVDAASTVAINTLEHPLMQRARKAFALDQCHREMPIVLQAADGTLIEGIADLIFQEDEGWVVVDFKTDHELASELDRYRRQVSIYAATIAKISGERTSAFLLRV